MPDRIPLCVVILTFNEEVNLHNALDSVIGWVDQVFIVDSFSTDRTLEIAKGYGCEVYQHPWTNWAVQRNWALENLPFRNDWVFFLDADEQITPELKNEIIQLFENRSIDCDGFYIKRDFIFMGRLIRHGGYNNVRVLRLFNRHKARSFGCGAREYIIVNGAVKKMRFVILHSDRRDIGFWIDKHNRLAQMEAKELFDSTKTDRLVDEGFQEGKELEGKGMILARERIWRKLPLLIRAFISFIYRYFLRMGFLDGGEGFIYFFLHEFWYPILIDIKYIELKKKQN